MTHADHLLLVSEDQGNAAALTLASNTVAEGARVSWICSTPTSQELHELEAAMQLKNSYMTALNLLVVTREESQPFEVLTGPIDANRIAACAELLFDAVSVTQAAVAVRDERQQEFAGWVSDALNGLMPQLLETKRQTLGLTRPSTAHPSTAHPSTAHPSTAHPSTPHPGPTKNQATNNVAVTLIIQGRQRSFNMLRTAGTLLEGAEEAGLDLPFSCRGGVCSTCRAKLKDGEVELRENYALDDWELDAGFTLPCQAEPISAKITLDYDEV